MNIYSYDCKIKSGNTIQVKIDVVVNQDELVKLTEFLFKSRAETTVSSASCASDPKPLEESQ